MVNKKIILGILTIGMLATVAAAGTYAYMQDTVSSTSNGVVTADLMTQYQEVASGSWTDVSTNALSAGVTLPNVLPSGDGTAFTAVKYLKIRNNNPTATETTPAGITTEVFLKITSTSAPSPVLKDLIIKVGPNVVYDGTGFITYTGIPISIGTLAPQTEKDLSVTYSFKNSATENQNAQAGQTVGFTIDAYVVPSGDIPKVA